MNIEKATPFNKYFDHTLLKPDATRVQIQSLIDEAIAFDVAAVCVNGCRVKYASEALKNTDVKVATVVGFPLGAMSPAAKAEETRIALADGAGEVDMVINIGAVRDGRWEDVKGEIAALAQICHGEAPDCAGNSHDGSPGETGSPKPSAILKVILETCLLTDEEIVSACLAAKEAGADFVKTSTGFSTGGATVHAVSLMKKTVGNALKVKASGGIRTLADAKAMIEAGADRLGCSASAAIMKEYKK